MTRLGMNQTITIDPKELMDTAVLLGTSALELADIGSTLRSCTGCAMPPEVRNSVDAIVATTDRVLDDMALQLRTEAADLAQRAIIAANDILTAAGYPPLPGTTTTPTPAPTISAPLVGGNNWGTITGPSFNFGANVIGGGSGSWGTLTGLPEGFSFGANVIGGGGGYGPSGVSGNPSVRIAEAIQKSIDTQETMLASGIMIPSGSFPMPGALSLSSLPTPSNPFLEMSEHIAIGKVEDELGRPVAYLTQGDKDYFGITT